MNLEESRKKLTKLLQKPNKDVYTSKEIKRLKNNISSIESRQLSKNITLRNNRKKKSKRETVSKEAFFHAYKLICKMKIPLDRKYRVLSELLAEYDKAWQVVGITELALKVFKKHGFNKISKMGINRAHIVPRNKTYKNILSYPINNCNRWWHTFITNDKTILATASENRTGKFSKKYKVNPKSGLFKAFGFSWSHGEPEKLFLKTLWKKRQVNGK